MATATKNAPKKTKAPPTPQDDALREIGRASEKVNQQWQRVQRAESDKETANEILKGAKADHLEAVKNLQATIADFTKPNLFNAGVAPSTNGVHKPAENPDAWKSEPLSALRDLGGLTQADLDRIEAKTELRTMGDLSKFLSDDRKQWTDLPGIGEKKVEKLQDAMEKFWAKHHGAGATVVREAREAIDARDREAGAKPEKDLPPAEAVAANGVAGK